MDNNYSPTGKTYSPTTIREIKYEKNINIITKLLSNVKIS